MMLLAFRRLVLQCARPAISLAMMYVNVVVSHVDDSTRVRVCSVFEFLSDECRASFYGAQTVEHRSRNAKVMGSNPSQVKWIFLLAWLGLHSSDKNSKTLHNLTRVESSTWEATTFTYIIARLIAGLAH